MYFITGVPPALHRPARYLSAHNDTGSRAPRVERISIPHDYVGVFAGFQAAYPAVEADMFGASDSYGGQGVHIWQSGSRSQSRANFEMLDGNYAMIRDNADAHTGRVQFGRGGPALIAQLQLAAL
jgi:hypothetical protein